MAWACWPASQSILGVSIIISSWAQQAIALAAACDQVRVLCVVVFFSPSEFQKVESSGWGWLAGCSWHHELLLGVPRDRAVRLCPCWCCGARFSCAAAGAGGTAVRCMVLPARAVLDVALPAASSLCPAARRRIKLVRRSSAQSLLFPLPFFFFSSRHIID